MKLIEVLYKEWNGEWKFPKGYDSVVQDGVAPFDVYAFGTNDFYFNWNEKVWVVGGNNPVVKVLQTTKLASDYDCAIVTKRAFLEYAAQVESKQRQSQIVVFPKSRSEAEAVANKLSDMGYKWTARKAVSDISWPAGAMVTTPNNKVVWIRDRKQNIETDHSIVYDVNFVPMKDIYVENGGKLYLKTDVEAALKTIKPVK